MGHPRQIPNLGGKRIALVYSFEAPSDPPGRWYDRWRTRVVMSYGEALERLSVHPYFCDIDTFCTQAFENRLPGVSAVISLNAGVRPVSHFGVVPAVGLWRQLPVIPSTADVVLAGERKDIATLIARDCGLSIAASIKEDELSQWQKDQLVIVKPRDLGGSYGLKEKRVRELNETDLSRDWVVQEFIEGYDVTVPVFYDHRCGSLCAGTGVVYIPKADDPRSWVYDREAKEAYVGGGNVVSVERIALPITPELEDMIVAFCDSLGVACFARCDFRWSPAKFDRSAHITPEGFFFIEVNPLPTICAGLAFVEGVRSSIKRNALAQADLADLQLDVRDDFDVIAYVLAQSLTRTLHPGEMNNGN